MKTRTITAVLTAVLFLTAAHLHSQAPLAPKLPLAALQAMKAANQQVIEKQAKTLTGLDDLLKSAQQIKAMGKRS